MKLFVLVTFIFSSVAFAQDTARPETVAPETATPNLSASDPRDFGYFVGDVFRREIDVTVGVPYTLERASLPKPGRLNYWLDLRDVKVAETESSGLRHYRLSLDYQTFYVPLSTTRLTVPGSMLHFSDDGGAVAVQLPPFAFVMSPLREIQPERPEEGPAGYLQPDAVPETMSTRRSRIIFSIASLGTLLGLALLAYHRAWWPFHARPQRPFTQAARAIKGEFSRDDDLEAYRTGLLELHRAFDISAGRRLLAEDVPVFLAEHRQFQPLKEEISRFFSTSRQAFFGNDMEGAAKVMPFASVATLGSRLGDAERRAA